MTSSQHGPLTPWATHVLQWEGQRVLRSRKVKLILQTFPQFGLKAATRLHEVGIASNRTSATVR